jgi:ferrous iron transport protein A
VGVVIGHPGNDSLDAVSPASLADLEVGTRARIVGVGGGRRMVRRCTALGLRAGAEVTISQRRGNSLVVISGNTRIALGPEMVDQIEVDPLPVEEAG